MARRENGSQAASCALKVASCVAKNVIRFYYHLIQHTRLFMRFKPGDVLQYTSEKDNPLLLILSAAKRNYYYLVIQNYPACSTFQSNYSIAFIDRYYTKIA